MSAEVRRATVLSFDSTAWTALVLLDGADFEAQMPVGQWITPTMMAANVDVAVLIFGETNTDDGLVLGPYNVTGGMLNLGTATAATVSGTLAATVADAGTNTVPNLFTLGHNTSAVPAAGFGQAVLYTLQTTTTPDTFAAYDNLIWVDPTHATRKARRVFAVYDTAQREALRLEASGTAAMIGFLGSAAQARPTAYTQTYATTTRTHANVTAVDPAAYAAGANGYSTAAMAQAVHAEVIALRADLVVVKNLLNSVIDDLQGYGLAA